MVARTTGKFVLYVNTEYIVGQEKLEEYVSLIKEQLKKIDLDTDKIAIIPVHTGNTRLERI